MTDHQDSRQTEPDGPTQAGDERMLEELQRLAATDRAEPDLGFERRIAGASAAGGGRTVSHGSGRIPRLPRRIGYAALAAAALGLAALPVLLSGPSPESQPVLASDEALLLASFDLLDETLDLDAPEINSFESLTWNDEWDEQWDDARGSDAHGGADRTDSASPAGENEA
ncbi:MAG: hypothetical protein AAGF47_00445 [Planctomycetota bacterium]